MAGPDPRLGIDWHRNRPPVCLDLWPRTYDADVDVFTPCRHGGASEDYVGDPEDFYDTRNALRFSTSRTSRDRPTRPLELALFLAESDAEERRSLEDRGGAFVTRLRWPATRAVPRVR